MFLNVVINNQNHNNNVISIRLLSKWTKKKSFSTFLNEIGFKVNSIAEQKNAFIKFWIGPKVKNASGLDFILVVKQDWNKVDSPAQKYIKYISIYRLSLK